MKSVGAGHDLICGYTRITNTGQEEEEVELRAEGTAAKDEGFTRHSTCCIVRHPPRIQTPQLGGGATLPFLPLPYSLFPFPSPFLSPPPFPSLPLEVDPLNTARWSVGECCKLPQRGLGQSPSGNRIWCILALKSANWWHQFY